ncbi:MAG: hypothetical protein ACYTCV_11155 [Planctomycetota bacterium]
MLRFAPPADAPPFPVIWDSVLFDKPVDHSSVQLESGATTASATLKHPMLLSRDVIIERLVNVWNVRA